MKDAEPNKSDVIEIPIGKFLGRVRENPWIISTFVFGILFFAVLIFSSGSRGANINDVGENVLAYLNSNPELQGRLALTSSEKEGQLYRFNLDYQGQVVPVYTTSDGDFLISNIVPIGNAVLSDINSGDNQAYNINEDDDAILGNNNAPVTIIEFSDYQCPFCRKFWTETLPSIKAEYIDTGKVKFIYRDYPIPSLGHDMAQSSAEAAECVREQGGDSAYWKMHDKLFSEQNILDSGNPEGPVRGTARFTIDDIKTWANEIGYNVDDCLDSGKFRSEVQKDLADGGSLGTPTFFVNGIKIEGAQPFSAFKQVIDSQL